MTFLFSPRKLEKMNPFWRAYFSEGLKPPTRSVRNPEEHWFGDVFFLKSWSSKYIPVYKKKCIIFTHLLEEMRQFEGKMYKVRNGFRKGVQAVTVFPHCWNSGGSQCSSIKVRWGHKLLFHVVSKKKDGQEFQPMVEICTTTAQEQLSEIGAGGNLGVFRW